MTDPLDTIAAVATPPGRGGIGVVRVSGPRVPDIAQVLLGRLPKARKAEYLPFCDAEGAALDRGIALYFPAPHSFTGENVLELQGHGGPVVLDMVLRRVLDLGARIARPGEFTERAFLNEKLDLAQAEAVADLIDAASCQAARSALRALEGDFSRLVGELREKLISLRVEVESALDFPEEEIDVLSDPRLLTGVEDLLRSIQGLIAHAEQGRLLREGMTVVIAGQPNTGKSSLLNALAGYDAAIVTDIPGTTRDLLREHIDLDGLPLHVVDTAGLRDSEDPVEVQGIQRAWTELGRADRILLVVEALKGVGSEERRILADLPAPIPKTIIYNKIDLTDDMPAQWDDALGTHLRLSVKTGQGLQELRGHLLQVMGYQGNEGTFTARRRHVEALRAAAQNVRTGRDRLVEQGAGELLAEELSHAQRRLGEITGEFTADDLLGRIFTTFCIGK